MFSKSNSILKPGIPTNSETHKVVPSRIQRSSIGEVSTTIPLITLASVGQFHGNADDELLELKLELLELLELKLELLELKLELLELKLELLELKLELLELDELELLELLDTPSIKYSSVSPAVRQLSLVERILPSGNIAN
jgi:hypothetical protein